MLWLLLCFESRRPFRDTGPGYGFQVVAPVFRLWFCELWQSDLTFLQLSCLGKKRSVKPRAVIRHRVMNKWSPWVVFSVNRPAFCSMSDALMEIHRTPRGSLSKPLALWTVTSLHPQRAFRYTDELCVHLPHLPNQSRMRQLLCSASSSLKREEATVIHRLLMLVSRGALQRCLCLTPNCFCC